MNCFIILPDQLFYTEKALKIIALHEYIYLFEEPHYFDAYQYHKSKIILHRASMQKYYNFLKTYFQSYTPKIKTTTDLNNNALYKKPKIIYISYFQLTQNKTTSENIMDFIENDKSIDKTKETKESKEPNDKSASDGVILNKEIKAISWIDWLKKNVEKIIVNMFEPANYLLWKPLLNNTLFNGLPVRLYPSPMFYLSIDEIMDNYKVNHTYRQTNFYINMRKKFTPWFLPDSDQKWTYDEFNRKTSSEYENEFGAILPCFARLADDDDFKNAVKYSARFKTIGKVCRYPITRDEALIYLKHFCIEKLKYFGPYEDISLIDNNIVFHSAISSSLNIGLLTPEEVINYITNYYNKYKNKIPIESYEAFIRQILGWREFMHMNYILNGENIKNANYFNLKRKITEELYTGKTGYLPIDVIIKDVLDCGYTHHINRLMFLGNFMLLQQFEPKDVFAWFMELFIDAYEWVMIPNIEMSQYNAGGFIGSRPYFSSANYLKKMGNYPKTTWFDKWNLLYYKFLNDHSSKLSSQYFVSNFVKLWKEKPLKERKKILEDAKSAFL